MRLLFHDPFLPLLLLPPFLPSSSPSQIFGWLAAFLWLTSLWFVYKDTHWHKDQSGPLASLYAKKKGTGRSRDRGQAQHVVIIETHSLYKSGNETGFNIMLIASFPGFISLLYEFPPPPPLPRGDPRNPALVH